jgi:hypothetical protein
LNIGDIVNTILQGLVDFVNLLVSWIPSSPFREFINNLGSSFGSDTLGYINYFLPITEMLGILTAWVSGILIYYTVQIILRWIKLIS